MLTINTLILFILALFVAHYIGDFILQSPWMANNKSHNLKALWSHATLYTINLWLIILGFSWIIGVESGAAYTVVNGLLHGATDYVTSKLAAKAWKDEKTRRFWLIIGADQAIHAVCLIITLPLLWSLS